MPFRNTANVYQLARRLVTIVVLILSGCVSTGCNGSDPATTKRSTEIVTDIRASLERLPKLPWILGAAVTQTGLSDVRYYQVTLSLWEYSPLDDVLAVGKSEPGNCAQTIKAFKLRGASGVPEVSPSKKIVQQELGIYFLTSHETSDSWEVQAVIAPVPSNDPDDKHTWARQGSVGVVTLSIPVKGTGTGRLWRQTSIHCSGGQVVPDAPAAQSLPLVSPWWLVGDGKGHIDNGVWLGRSLR